MGISGYLKRDNWPEFTQQGSKVRGQEGIVMVHPWEDNLLEPIIREAPEGST